MEVLELDPTVIIVPEDRVRKTFDEAKLDELANSLKKGQIHPVRITNDMKLVAGERRLRACIKHGLKILAIKVENTDPAELLEIEIMENLEREQMTWQEKVDGLARLNELKQSIHGVAKAGVGKGGWSMADTAELAKECKATVHEAIQMAEALKVFPELATSKSQSDAKKKLNKLKETLAIAELMKRKQGSMEGLLAKANEGFIVADALKGMQSLLANSVDFANVDTPYGIDLTEQKKIQSDVRTDDDYIEWPKDIYIKNIVLIAEQCYRILKPNSWMLFWFGQEWYKEVFCVLKDAGFGVDKIPGVWYGGAGAAQTMAPEVNLGRSYEQFFICRKGDPILVKRGRPNVFCFDKLGPQNKIHPTEKPLPLMVELLETFLLPGQVGISPLIGSGNDLRAGYIHNCHWFGFDLNSDVKNKFLLRVEADIQEGLYGH